MRLNTVLTVYCLPGYLRRSLRKKKKRTSIKDIRHSHTSETIAISEYLARAIVWSLIVDGMFVFALSLALFFITLVYLSSQRTSQKNHQCYHRQVQTFLGCY